MKCFQRQPNDLTASRTSFQFMSDLHLEVGQQYREFNFPAVATYLILAGDIGRLKDYQPYLEFLQRQCSKFAKVFLVLGNHEFFGTSRAKALELARSLEKEPGCDGKLHVMDKTRIDLDVHGITLLGCTLHTNIPDKDKLMVRMKVGDFQHINEWTTDDHNSEHRQDVAWLQNEVSDIRSGGIGRKILVMTHHAPTIKGTSKPKDTGNPWSSAFATELTGFKELRDVHYWIFGHTHFSTEFKRGRTQLASNQRGYVLNGVALGGRGSSPSQLSILQRLFRLKNETENDFDIEKIVRI